MPGSIYPTAIRIPGPRNDFSLASQVPSAATVTDLYISGRLAMFTLSLSCSDEFESRFELELKDRRSANLGFLAVIVKRFAIATS